jgi:hypothetical protein
MPPELRGPACERSLTQRARDYLATLASGTAQVDLGEPDKFGGRIDARVTARGADLLSAMLGHAPPAHSVTLPLLPSRDFDRLGDTEGL